MTHKLDFTAHLSPAKRALALTGLGLGGVVAVVGILLGLSALSDPLSDLGAPGASDSDVSVSRALTDMDYNHLLGYDKKNVQLVSGADTLLTSESTKVTLAYPQESALHTATRRLEKAGWECEKPDWAKVFYRTCYKDDETNATVDLYAQGRTSMIIEITA